MERNNTIKVYALLLLIALSNTVFGQQDPMYTQYMFNMSTVNPAANGMIDQARFISLNRFQFVGIEGAPTTYSLSADVPIPRYNSAAGINYAFDKLGPERSNHIYLDYSYHIHLSKRIKMGMGIKAGMKMYSADFNGLSENGVNDDAFANNIKGDIMPNFGLGIMVYSDDFFAGIAAPRLINHELEGVDDAAGTTERHYFLTGGYNWQINSDIILRPVMHMKFMKGVFPSFDVTANCQMYEKFLVGLAFRSYDAVSILAQVEVYKGLHVGYVYDISINKLRKGSHEILLSYRTTLFRTGRGNSKFKIK